MALPALKKMQKQQPRTFAMKFDALCQLYGDPLAGLFALAYSSTDEEVRLRAFAELLPYRHPRLKQVEHVGERTGPQVVMQINMTPSQAREVAARLAPSTPILPTSTGEVVEGEIVRGERVTEPPSPPLDPLS